VAVASVDICGNSELVKKHKPAMMEKVYYRLWDFLKHRLDMHDGRMWSWRATAACSPSGAITARWPR